MKTSTYFSAAAAAALIVLSSSQHSNLSVSGIELHQAIKRGDIYAESFGAGGFSGISVKLKLQNRKQAPITLHIPPGTLFFPKDPGQQTLITVEDQVITLAPGEKRVEDVYAYCSEHNDRSPNKSTSFTIGKNTNAKFDSLFAFIRPLKIPQNDHQSMVWAVSDNSPVSAVSTGSQDLKKLRKFLFKMTGQSESDYTSGYILSVDENGYIVKKLYRITGDMEFSSDRTRYLYQMVYTPEGKLKFKSNMALEIPSGKSQYNFSLVVKDWPSGTYTLKMVDGKEEVGTYTFNV